VPSARFNRLLAVYQVLPGPEAHELCVHLGMLSGRRTGGILAGLGFMLPGFVPMLALSWLYFSVGLAGTLAAAAFLGVQPAVVALVARAVHRIGAHVLLDGWPWAIAVTAGAAALAGAPFRVSLPVAASPTCAQRAGGRRQRACSLPRLRRSRSPVRGPCCSPNRRRRPPGRRLRKSGPRSSSSSSRA
jgi:hypothetical protein